MSVIRAVRQGRVRWEVRWRDGARHRSRTFDRKADAAVFDREIARRRQMGAHNPGEPARTLLEQWLEHWWETRSGGWERSTQLQRAGVLDRWVVPFLGSVRLRDLGQARVREYFAEIQRAGCPPTTANHALAVLSAALGREGAVADGLIPANPCLGIRKVPVKASRPRPMLPLDVERLRAAMPSLRDAVIVSLLCYAGLRPGELHALTWDSVGRVLVIDSALSEGRLKGTKSMRLRTVEIVEPLAEDIAELRPRVTMRGEPVAPGERKGQGLNHRNWTRRVWRPAADGLGLSAVPYDGRHTFASLLINEGRSIAYVAAAMGHASAQTTLDNYVHLFEEARLGRAVPMVDAIRSARERLARSGVRRKYEANNVRVLRTRLRRAEK